MRRHPFRALSASSLVLALLSCGGKTVDPGPVLITTTYRAIGGISMGAIGSAALSAMHPERFDAVAPLGGPLDAALLLRTVDRFHLGGFCTRADLEALMAASPSNLNDPKLIDACARHPKTLQWEHPQDFNHWAYTTSGANFDRDQYWEIFADLTLGYGNFLTYNPASPFSPPGVDPARLKDPPADFCTNPVRIKNFRNAEYNADGKYDAITFCDGQRPVYYCARTLEVVDFCSDPANIVNPLSATAAQAFAGTYCAAKGGSAIASRSGTPLILLNNAGKFDPCRVATTPGTVALALDLNGNGRRDYGEPILVNAQERFDDVGVDGCSDAYEDGKGGCTTTANPNAVDPNRDNYDADTNPLGTENDWVWEKGEPFRDDGVDGVPGTGDYGEGNGKFDMVPGRQNLMKWDARTALKTMPSSVRNRINWLLDGGIRDVFNFGLMAKQVFGMVNAYAGGGGGSYRRFADIPGMLAPDGVHYQPFGGPWRRVPRNMAVLYGNDPPSDQDRINGEGDHVGTNEEAVQRLLTVVNWVAQAQWPSLPRPSTPLTGLQYQDRSKLTWFNSTALRAKREFAIYVPPGYELPENQGVRYPVLFFLHGYGMNAGGMMDDIAGTVVDTSIKDPAIQLRPMIMVFPDGRCCFTNTALGLRDCREADDTGTPFDQIPGWRRECNAGSFFVNRQGYTPTDGSGYADSFFELMDYVDQNYRTLPTAKVEKR